MSVVKFCINIIRFKAFKFFLSLTTSEAYSNNFVFLQNITNFETIGDLSRLLSFGDNYVITTYKCYQSHRHDANNEQKTPPTIG